MKGGYSCDNWRHGMHGTPEYNTWQSMKQRCSNPNNTDYSLYGGRGISYDPSWNDFVNFYRDMGSRPEGCTLDRIDNEGNYCKANCRWATPDDQRSNRRVSITLELNGVRMGFQQVCEELDINYSTARARYRKGWDLVDVFELRYERNATIKLLQGNHYGG